MKKCLGSKCEYFHKNSVLRPNYHSCGFDMYTFVSTDIKECPLTKSNKINKAIYEIMELQEEPPEAELEIDNLENAIKEYFDVRLGIELEDSPQINQEYVYLEFEDRGGSDRKIRARYTNTYAAFLLLPFDKQIKFLLEQIVRDAYGM